MSSSTVNAPGRPGAGGDVGVLGQERIIAGAGFNRWLERVGQRKAGVVSAMCWCGGMLISALGGKPTSFG